MVATVNVKRGNHGNLFLVTSDRALRRRILAACAEVDDLVPIGASTSVERALPAPPLEPVDVVLVKLALPMSRQAYAARAFRDAPWSASVVAISDRGEDDAALFTAIRIGAAAFVAADSPPEYLVSMVRRVLAGEFPIQYSLLNSPTVAGQLLRYFREAYLSFVPAAPGPLSQRDLEILGLVAAGCSNKEIAGQLSLGVQTVKNRITGILHSIQAQDRAHAAVLALRHGWLMMR
ncbi:MAG: response regulator transcription factor [Chloroflexi bacterium]|nr:response regulator transcription factor [Chloroflexota bacterium]